MKTVYETDERFRKFINERSALSFLPIEDIENGLKYLDEKYEFDDEKVSDFKNSFVDYINSFWIQGCFPPRTWNTYERSEVFTNKAQVQIAILKRLYSIQCNALFIAGGLQLQADQRIEREPS